MIFKLHYGLMLAGWYATTVLLGSYMSVYANANKFDLGFVFMVLPMTIFLRPFICAQADRSQSHKKLLVIYIFSYGVCYTPFIVWPYLKIHYQIGAPDSGINWPFWLLTLAHLGGSISFSGARSLGDAAAVNHAKKVGEDFTSYRVYGAYTYGAIGYLFGLVNEDNPYFPDFVPALLLNFVCVMLDAILIFIWPDEFFQMSAKQQLSNEKADSDKFDLPSNDQIWQHIKSRIFCSQGSKQENDRVRVSKVDREIAISSRKSLSIKQQVNILVLLMKRDFRITLYLMLIFYTGFTAYAPLNFVFTYMDHICRSRGSCSGAEIGALMIVGYCIVEAISYLLIGILGTRMNHFVLLGVTFFSVANHFYFYGFFMDIVSPYWFLIESLHGLEYAICLSISVNLGYMFAREVDMIIPELIERDIVSRSDKEEQNLVRVSLMATMGSLFALGFEGVGCTIGAVVFGQIAGIYSFSVLWICVGSLASIGLVIMIVTFFLARSLDMKPQFLQSTPAGGLEMAS